MRILLITGRLAEPMVRRAAREAAPHHECNVMALPVGVAAFLHPRYVARQLQRHKLPPCDLILLPGLVQGDTSTVTKAIGIPTYKGPRHAADLPHILRTLGRGPVPLSTTQPADHVLAERMAQEAARELAEAEAHTPHPLPPGTLRIGRGRQSLLAGPTYPMRIIAEIIDAPTRTPEELVHLARHYVDSGASIIDVGMVAGDSDPQAAGRIVKTLRRAVSTPISIDSTDPKELTAGLEAGADFVLSLTRDNMEAIPSRLRRRAVFTVIPASKEESPPREAEKRLQLLEENLEEARRLGYIRLAADPLLEPPISPGLLPSIQAYALFASRHPHTPLLMGTGNVTELVDADTPGANALLAALASELGVSLLLTTEASSKSRGAVWELHRAAQMMFLARRRQSPPKDLGLNLLLLKAKTFTEILYDPKQEQGVPVVSLSGQQPSPARLDPKGHFTIQLDRGQQLIVVHHYPTPKSETPDLVIRAPTAAPIADAITSRGLISSQEHAAYLGIELAKAEVALRTGRPYLQDAPLFPSRLA